MKCIYSGKEGEHFPSREHVISAFLGGGRTLDGDLVSAETNQYFSSMEDKLAHISDLSILRDLHGPGKRGANTPSHPVLLRNGSNFPLIAVKIGESFVIQDQIRYFFGAGGFATCFLPASFQESQNAFAATLNSCSDLRNRIKSKPSNVPENFLEDPLCPEGFAAVSFIDGKWYVCAKRNFLISKIKSLSLLCLYNKNLERAILPSIETDSLSVSRVCSDSDETSRMLTKTIFNAYIFHHGRELSTSTRFAQIRDYIYSGKPMQQGLSAEIFADASRIVREKGINENAHMVMIFPFLGGLCGAVWLYGGEYAYATRLADKTADEENELYVYSCEWMIENKSKRDKDFSIAAADINGYVFDENRLPKDESLSRTDNLMGKTLNQKARETVSSFLSKSGMPKVLVGFIHQGGNVWSQIEGKTDGSFEIRAKWNLDSEEFSSFLIEELELLQETESMAFQIAFPQNWGFDGEADLAAMINFLLSFSLIDKEEARYGFCAQPGYSTRFNSFVSQIIDNSATNFTDDFLVAKYALEASILLIYNPKMVSEIKSLLLDGGATVLSLSKEIMDAYAKAKLSNLLSRLATAKKIIEILDIGKHLSVYTG